MKKKKPQKILDEWMKDLNLEEKKGMGTTEKESESPRKEEEETEGIVIMEIRCYGKKRKAEKGREAMS